MEILSNISCGVCSKVFNDKDRKPLFLPCGDTFCQMCISQEFQPKQYLKCKECQEVHKDLQINQLPVAKQLLKAAQLWISKTPSLVCDCKQDRIIDFFCQQDEKLCCAKCCFECTDHKNLILKITNIKSELEELKEIIDNQIIQKAQNISNQIKVYLDSQGERQTIYGTQINLIVKQAFNFIKEMLQIQPKSQYLQYQKTISKLDQQEILKLQNEIDQEKRNKTQVIQDIQSDLNQFKEQINKLRQDQILSEQKIQKIDQLELMLKNQNIKMNESLQIILKFDPNKFHKEIQITEENQVAKSSVGGWKSGLLDLTFQFGKKYEIEFLIVDFGHIFIGIALDNQDWKNFGSSIGGQTKGYGFVFYKGYYQKANNENYQIYGQEIQQNNKITMLVNTQAKNISFKINNTCYESAFENIDFQNQIFYPGISIGYANSKGGHLKILKCVASNT